MPSATLAVSAGTSATVIRQLMTRLRSAGFVRSQLGVGGGSELALSADEITLLDVYDAVETEPIFPPHRNPPSEECLVGRNILCVLSPHLQQAQDAMREHLRSTTIRDIAQDVQACKVTEKTS